jgi:hypothetical protein
MGRGRDQIDRLCDEWARVRRELIGLRQPVSAKGYLGAVHCTLGQRRDLHAGARSRGRVEQHFPEVYLPGNEQLVNTAFHRMSPTLAEIMDWHYVLEMPRDKRKRADLMGISPQQYWDRVKRAKTFIEGAVAIVDSVRTL